MSVGRNEPCPCGSGKKYKRCCLQKDNPTVSDDLPWRQVRAARESLNAKMMEFSVEVYGKDALHLAWEEWCCEHEEPLAHAATGADMRGSEFVLFMSWFLVNWIDHDAKKKIPLPPLSWKFRKAFEGKLSPIENEYLNSIIDEPFSFFELLGVKPGEGYLARDILTGREMFIYEKSGSMSAQIGGFLFGRLAIVGEVTIFDAVAEILFPVEWKGTVLEARQSIRKALKIKKDAMPSPQDIRGFEEEIRTLYRDLKNAAENPKPPTLTNTDGEPLSFNKVIFQIENANDVFEAIHSLCFSRSRQELRDDADLDGEGKINRIEFPWLGKGNKLHKEWDNTVLGNVTLEHNRLVVETNSLERVESIKKLISKLCGKLAKHKTTLIEPLEAKLAEMKNKGLPDLRKKEMGEELKNHPEIQARLKEMHKTHMERWVTEKIPALGGKTPIQAVKTSEGREMVSALLMQFEKGAGVMADKEFELGVLRGVRERLGLS